MKLAIQCKCGETVYVEADLAAGQEIIDTLARCVRCWKCTTPYRGRFQKPKTSQTFKPYRAPYAD